MRSLRPTRFAFLSLVFVAVALATTAPSVGQEPAADPQADALLQSARQAYRDRNFTQAAEQFGQFIEKYPKHAEVSKARFALTRVWLEGPTRNYQAAADVLVPLVEDKKVSNRGHVLYHAGLAQRGLGEQALADARAKPSEAAKLEAAAKERFERAYFHFIEASTDFDDADWVARAMCDAGEMLLRFARPELAAAAVDAIANADLFLKNRYRPLALYLYAQAMFALDKRPEAFRNLGQLAPFDQPGFGLHARYMLARLHDLEGERPEAAAQYEAVLAGYEAQKKAAAERLVRDRPELRDKPDERARLQSLARDPPPEYVARSGLFLGILQYGDGGFGEAAASFAAYLKTNPPTELANEARLRLGMSQVQAKQPAEAVQTLRPLTQTKQAAAALAWTARAKSQAADPKKPTYSKDMQSAADDFTKAIQLAEPLAKDQDAKQQIADWMLDLTDVLMAAGKFHEAGLLCIDRPPFPRQAELTQAKLAIAIQLERKFALSYAACSQFEKLFPRSPLRAEIAFRSAENMLQMAQAEEANHAADARDTLDKAIRHYRDLSEKFPDAPQASLGRYALATAQYRRGDYRAAADTLSKLADAERTGELAGVSYLQADCLLRTLPIGSADAISAARLVGQLEEAIKLLTRFTAGPQDAPRMPEGTLRLGSAQLDLAALVVDPKERTALLTAARQNFEKFKQFGEHPLKGEMYFERGRCTALGGDMNAAVNTDLKRFTTDPWNKMNIAPLLLLRMATYQRQAGQPKEAVATLEQCRATYAAQLEADPLKREWLASIQFGHAVALREAGQLAEARKNFEQVAAAFPATAEGLDAVERAALCQREEALQQLETVRRVVSQRGANADVLLSAAQTRDEALVALRAAAERCTDLSKKLNAKPERLSTQQRLLYAAAWCERTVAEVELVEKRREMQEQRLDAARQALIARMPAGQNPPDLRPGGIPLTDLPVTDGGRRTVQAFRALIASGGETPLSIDARLELAELYAARHGFDDALALAREALDGDPSAEQAERLLLVSGECLLAKKDFSGAAARFTGLAGNAKSALAPAAKFYLGEIAWQQRDWKLAVERLSPFRDQARLQNVADVSDKAQFRLGYALLELQQWDAARQTLEAFQGVYAAHPWRDEACLLVGFACQKQGKFDEAVASYQRLANRSPTAAAARAQLGLGECLAEQGKRDEALAALALVNAVFDDPEATAEAKRKQSELKQ